MEANRRLRAAKIGYVVISILIGALGAALVAVPEFSAALLCRVGGALLLSFGVVKIIGYCSRDLYRLAFQYDLAAGLLLIALGAAMLLRTSVMTGVVCVLLGLYTLGDALLKIQMSMDARAFGIRWWWLILAAAAVTGAAGFLLVFRPLESTRFLMALLGGALLAESLLNLITMLTAVQGIRR